MFRYSSLQSILDLNRLPDRINSPAKFQKMKTNLDDSRHLQSKENKYKSTRTLATVKKAPLQTIMVGSPFSPLKKEREPPRKRLRRIMMGVLAAIRLKRRISDLKLYGTSTVMFDIGFKNRTAILNSLFPSVASDTSKPRKYWYILDLESRFLFYWNFLIVFFLLYAMSVMPAVMAFQTKSTIFQVIEIVMDICFISDILLNFITAYDSIGTETEYQRVYSLRKIALNYLKSFFIIDLLTSIPLELIIDEGASFNKLLRLLRFPRFIKILKFEKLLVSNRLKYFVRINGALIKSLILGIITLILLHISSCVWCFLGLYDEADNISWVHQYGLQNHSPSELYFISLYFMLVTLTTVGYGDLLPRTNTEIIFIIVWMLTGVVFYSLAVGLISAIFTDRNTKAAVLARQTNQLYSISASLKIKPGLTALMIEALANNSNKSTYFTLDPHHEVLDGLPIGLKYDFLYSLYGPLIQGNAFFKDSNKSFIIRIIPLLRPYHISAGNNVFTEGGYSRCLYLLEEGLVEMSVSLNPANLKNRVKVYGGSNRLENLTNTEEMNILEAEDLKEERVAFKIMTGGAFFGDSDIIERRSRLCTAQAISDCHLYVLNRTDFESVVVDEFPDLFNELKALGRKRDKDDLNKISKALKLKFSTSSMSEMDNKIKTVLKSLEICKKTKNAEYNLKPLKKMYEDIKEKNLFDEFMHAKGKKQENKDSDSDINYTDIDSDHLTNMHEETTKIGDILQTKTHNMDQSGMTPRKLRNLEKRINVLQNQGLYQAVNSIAQQFGTKTSPERRPLQQMDSIESSARGLFKPKLVKIEERYLMSLEEQVRDSRTTISTCIQKANSQLQRLEAILEDMHNTEVEMEPSSHYYTFESDGQEEQCT